MSAQGHAVRAARRGDIPQLVDLRVQHLGAVAKQEPPARLSPDARARIEQALPVWLGQEDRAILVAEADSNGTHADGEPALTGYAMGTLNVWPPVLRSQHVGEILECFVVPPHRGKGIGRALLATLTDILRRRGSDVLRASVPVRNEEARRQLTASGYEPLYYVMTRSLDDL